MRAQLLAAVMIAYPNGRNGAPTVIDDIIREARVSRGTFYKYFDSLDQAVAELGAQMAIEMNETMKQIYDPIDDPVQRVATGFQTYLLRAMQDRSWGAFLVHIGLASSDDPTLQMIRSDIALGCETGDYSVPSLQVAGDLLLGAKVEALRRIITGAADLPYIHAMTVMVLCSFGVSSSRADKVVAITFNKLLEVGPSSIVWWRSLDGAAETDDRRSDSCSTYDSSPENA